VIDETAINLLTLALESPFFHVLTVGIIAVVLANLWLFYSQVRSGGRQTDLIERVIDMTATTSIRNADVDALMAESMRVYNDTLLALERASDRTAQAMTNVGDALAVLSTHVDRQGVAFETRFTQHETNVDRVARDVIQANQQALETMQDGMRSALSEMETRLCAAIQNATEESADRNAKLAADLGSVLDELRQLRRSLDTAPAPIS